MSVIKLYCNSIRTYTKKNGKDENGESKKIVIPN